MGGGSPSPRHVDGRMATPSDRTTTRVVSTDRTSIDGRRQRQEHPPLDASSKAYSSSGRAYWQASPREDRPTASGRKVEGFERAIASGDGAERGLSARNSCAFTDAEVTSRPAEFGPGSSRPEAPNLDAGAPVHADPGTRIRAIGTRATDRAPRPDRRPSPARVRPRCRRRPPPTSRASAEHRSPWPARPGSRTRPGRGAALGSLGSSPALRPSA